MMNKSFTICLAGMGMLLASSSLLPAASHAIEVTAGDNDTNNTYNAAQSMAQMRAEFLRQQIAKERADRIQGDIDLRQDIQTRMDEVDTRVTELDNRVSDISSQIDLSQTGFLQEIEDLKTETDDLRTLMNSELARLDGEIIRLRNYMNGRVADLQRQINEINASINELNTRMSNIRNRLTNLENFANQLNARLAQLTACFAAGSCVGYKSPQVEVRTIDVWGNGGGYGGMNTYNTGLRTSQWQFCSLAGATNQGYRDFRIWESGGYWYVANEHGGNEGFLGFGSAQGGSLWARCMRIY